MARQLRVEIIGDASSLEKALGSAGQKTSGFSRGLKQASFVAVGAFAAMGLAAKMGFDELAEGQKVSAQTAAALKSTGAVANVTAKDVESLAGSISKMTGIDDEAIQAGENLLLTFKNVRNEVGRGADVFDRATRASVDLSVAGFGSLDSTAKMLGKALNDPIRGMVALSRAGVTFSDDQRKAIKALVETGDALGAQKIILREVESQVGGSGKAYGETLPGQLAKARNSFDEMAANLTGALVPAITAFAGALSGVSKFLSEHETLAKALVGTLAALAGVVLATSAAVKVYAAAEVIAAAAAGAWTAAQWLLNAAIIANPIALVVVALAALVAGIILAWRESETFREIVTGAFTAVKTAANAVLGFFRANWPIIATLIAGPFAPLVLLATDAFGIRSKLIAAFTAVKDWVSSNWKVIATLISGPFLPLVALATNAFGIRSAMVSAFTAIKDFVVGAINAITDAIETLSTKGLSMFRAFAKALAAPVGVITGLFNGVASAIENIRGAAVAALDKISELINMIPNIPSAGGLFNAIIPGRQHGGPVRRGHPYVVGEAGPELFIPTASGNIQPNTGVGLTSAGGGAVNVYVQGSVVTERQLVEMVREELMRLGRYNAGGVLGGAA